MDFHNLDLYRLKLNTAKPKHEEITDAIRTIENRERIEDQRLRQLNINISEEEQNLAKIEARIAELSVGNSGRELSSLERFEFCELKQQRRPVKRNLSELHRQLEGVKHSQELLESKLAELRGEELDLREYIDSVKQVIALIAQQRPITQEKF